ncbi:MAG: dienelactone hydrolase family protein [Rhizomicrobium sp.]|jgi:dienelactone hydrolase
MGPGASLHYVCFPSLHGEPLTIGARLRLPQAAAHKLPAVLILHGSAGPSLREGGYADVLNEAGFVTLEPDQWAARGLRGGADGRPKTVIETLPDVFGARAFLAGHPAVDTKRIGVIGFSFGGVAAMLAATRAQNSKFLDGTNFAALMPVYPVCWTYNRVPGFEFRDLVDAPVHLVTGALDQYDNDPEAGPRLVAALPPEDRGRVRVSVMVEAHHGFDMPGADMEVHDPFGNQGKGGPLTMRYNPDATLQSHRLAVEFFTRALAR